MNDNQQLRASALQIAAMLLGPLPKGADFDDESAYQDYFRLAAKLETYITHGSLHPKPQEGIVGKAKITG